MRSPWRVGLNGGEDTTNHRARTQDLVSEPCFRLPYFVARGRAAKLSKGYGGHFRSVASGGGGQGGLAVLWCCRSDQASCLSSACPCQTGDRCSTTEWAGIDPNGSSFPLEAV